MSLVNKFEGVSNGDMVVLSNPELRVAGFVHQSTPTKLVLGLSNPHYFSKNEKVEVRANHGGAFQTYGLEDFDSYGRIKIPRLERLPHSEISKDANIGEIVMLTHGQSRIIGFINGFEPESVILTQLDPLIAKTVSVHFAREHFSNEATRILRIKEEYSNQQETSQFSLRDYAAFHILNLFAPVAEPRVSFGSRFLPYVIRNN